MSANAVRCGYKMSPPSGSPYGAINVPAPPGTYHVHYSFWSSPDGYYARRIRPDGTYAVNILYSGGGQHDYTNSVDVDRRTQLKNYNGSVFDYWVQANSQTYC